MTVPITIIGLGPGKWEDLTLQVHTLLAQAEKEQTPVYFRTLVHPTVEPIQAAFPALPIESFDSLYDESENWEKLYQQIAERVCTLGTQGQVIYAVPGHPLIGESTVQRVLAMAKERNLHTNIVAGLSFLEPVCTAVGLDPLEAGTQIMDATALASLDTTEVAGKIIPTIPLLVAQVYNRRTSSAVKLALSECYPDEWPVRLVKAAGVDTDKAVIDMPLYELDRNTLANHLCTLYVPPVTEMTALRLAETLRYITMRLRRDPDGCPWDREQTHTTLIPYVIEEAYEVVHAIEENDMENLAEELGDLLLQVYLHAEVARQEGDFSIGDVFEHVNAKLIRRHPHVFGEVEVSGAAQVVQNWEAIKQQEKQATGEETTTKSVLDGVASAAPALIVAQEYQKKASKTGFEYHHQDEIIAKLHEELQELQEAQTPEHKQEELGDLLFIAVRLAQMLKINAEDALRQANLKFRKRFQAMEAIIHAEGRTFDSYSTDEWIALWKRVKEETTQ